jgi:hypothetical protein
LAECNAKQAQARVALDDRATCCQIPAIAARRCARLAVAGRHLVYCLTVADHRKPVKRLRPSATGPDPVSDKTGAVAGAGSEPADGQGGGTLQTDMRELQAALPERAQRGSLLCIAGTNADLDLHVVIEEPVMIGREPGHALRLHDGGISRTHAVVGG